MRTASVSTKSLDLFQQLGSCGWNHGGGTVSVLGQGLAEAGAFAEDEIEPALWVWAHALGLTRMSEPMSGAVEYHGHVSGCSVLVWGVVDRDCWEEAPSAMELRCALVPDGHRAELGESQATSCPRFAIARGTAGG